ncbi:uncharacterized protein LOC125034547 [Penaeus chinensis]|uniref:uncharacterized protein LOC125034547 n=1 Tax=Penaeus chinensis TaxID=139456 RepID=UPI001FB65042|nr:uncharacterized protein LOC125034547 [Penaeus chinensis]
MTRTQPQALLKVTVAALAVALCTAFPGQFHSSSQVSSSGYNTGAQSQFVNQDGVTIGQCSYLDEQGREVKIDYTEYPDGRLEAKARETFVTDPKAALRTCQNQVKVGQDQLEEQLRQDLFGGFGVAQPQGPAFGADGGFAFGSDDASFPGQGIIQGSSSWGGSFPNQGAGSFQGSSYFGSNFPSQGPGVFQVSSGDFGAQILVVSQDGVTTGLCSYVDQQGRSVKINYSEYPNGTVEADSNQDFVTDPVAALEPCKEAVRRQQESHRQLVLQLEKEQQELQQNLQRQQQNLQEQLHRQQQNLQNQLRRQQATFRRQQQSLQDQLRSQHQNIFGSGNFPFSFPNFPIFYGDADY